MPYKELSDSTLMHMTKNEIIEQLRCAEHNYRSCEAQVAQQYENTKDWRPVKHGHWVFMEVDCGTDLVVKCSVCGEEIESMPYEWKWVDSHYERKPLYKGCPFCLAVMDDDT